MKMLEVAGMVAQTVRPMCDDSDEPLEETEVEPMPKDFVPAIRLIKKAMTPEQATAVSGSSCFGWMWEDDDEGVCPEDGERGTLCALRAGCRQVWNQVHIKRVAAVKAARSDRQRTGKSIVSAELKTRVLDIPKRVQSDAPRHKWQGTGKFARKGYAPFGRPVDELVAAFIDGLADPPVLPRIFNSTNFIAKYGDLGPCTIAKTGSYHAVYHFGVMVARLWTNSAKAANVDVVPELTSTLMRASVNLGEDNGRLQLEPPMSLSPTALSKSKPCTHRIKIRTEAAARTLAEVLVEVFGWKRNKR